MSDTPPCAVSLKCEYRNIATHGTMRVLDYDEKGLTVVHYHPKRKWNNTRRRQNWATFRALYTPLLRITH